MILAEGFANSPTGYFLDLAVLVAIPTVGWLARKFGKRLDTQDTTLSQLVVSTTVLTEAMKPLRETATENRQRIIALENNQGDLRESVALLKGATENLRRDIRDA